MERKTNNQYELCKTTNNFLVFFTVNTIVNTDELFLVTN